MNKRVLITGGAGFLGHHLVEALLKETDWEIITLDRLDTSGTLHRLTDIDIWEQERQRVQFVYHDLKAPIQPQLAKRIGPVHMIFHLAASTHVDRSIEDPLLFVYDNVVGTCHLLQYARTLEMLEWFVYFGTDEVFGPAAPGQKFREWDRYCSKNPYAATKAGAEELCLAFQNTYKLPVLITHCMNIFGERQHPEKFIPSTIRKIRDGEPVIIHADPTRTRPGSRFYIHARNVANALLFLLHHPNIRPGEKYNIVGEQEVNNLELAQMIAEIMQRPLTAELVDFHSSRPGHDLRYALDGWLMHYRGWKPHVDFPTSLSKVVRWTLNHPEWL